MITRKKSKALKDLEKMTGETLTIANLLWAIRTSDDVNQVDFAKKLNISNQYLCDLERGRKSLSPKKAKEFAQKLGYSEEQFIALALQDALNQDGMHFVVELKAVA
jgi:transcriptional regulator with XRE-family HTH domain